MKSILIFASGTADGGGSGFQTLAESTTTGILDAKRVGAVSNHKNGGVYKKAQLLDIPFIYFSGPFAAENYHTIIQNSACDFVVLSGWLKLMCGINPATTINIHPGLLPRFGGVGMYGIYVHEAVLDAHHHGEITHSAVTMHFVTEKYDKGPIFFQYPVPIRQDDTADTLKERVGEIEHSWQPFITNFVVKGDISWDGKDPSTLRVPAWYNFHKIKT